MIINTEDIYPDMLAGITLLDRILFIIFQEEVEGNTVLCLDLDCNGWKFNRNKSILDKINELDKESGRKWLLQDLKRRGFEITEVYTNDNVLDKLFVSWHNVGIKEI